MRLSIQSSVPDMYLNGADFKMFPTHLRHLPFLGEGSELTPVVRSTIVKP
jgi:hypothetical protein